MRAPTPLTPAREDDDGGAALRLLRGMRLHLGLGGAIRTPRPGGGRPVLFGESAGLLPDGQAGAARAPEARLLSTASHRAAYELHGELARGGVGVVLRARDRVLGRDVAIKVLQDRHRGDPAVLGRFVQEARIGARLRHRGIVTVHELGTLDDGRPFFSMELVRGETLAALLDRRDAPTRDQRRLLDVFEEVCLAVAHAHQHGVVHLDLKPANVMVGHFGEVQVMDWGIARVLGEASDLQGPPGAALGTPTIMAPEQARGDDARIDRRTDVFALGGLLLELLTGRPTFVDDAELAAAVVHGDLDAALARLRLAGAPEPLAELVRDCLAVDPGRRPPDAGEVHRRVRACRVAERAARRAPPPRRHAERGARRLGALSLVAALGVLGSLGAEGCARALQDEVQVLLKAPAEKIR